MSYEINEQKNILDYKRRLDYMSMMKYVDVFAKRYSFIGVTNVGRSIMGRSIPIITLGRGADSLLYVGAHRSDEWLTSIILLRFINEYCELYKNRGRIYNTTLEYMYSTKTIYIVPMLNPDEEETDGEYDVGELCNFLRFNDGIREVLSLRLGREGVCSFEDDSEQKRSLYVARSISRMSGYPLSLGDGPERAEKFIDWCLSETDIPIFSIKCGEDKKNFNADWLFRIYADMREPLFRTPFLV